MSLVAAGVLVAASGVVQILALTITPREGRTALRVETAGIPANASVERRGEEVLVTLSGQVVDPLVVPAPRPPLRGIRLERGPGTCVLHLSVPPEIRYEVQREPSSLTVFFETEAASSEAEELQSLYQKIFPVPSSGAIDPGISETGTDKVEGAADQSSSANATDGLRLGPVALKPTILVAYVDADSTLESSRPVSDRFLQIEPSLGAEAPLRAGSLRASYKGTFRPYSAFEVVRHPTHQFEGALELPIGTQLNAVLSEHFEHGTLETTEVDPGQEYFFQLGTFSHQLASGRLREDLAGRWYLEAGGTLDRVRVDASSSFFDHDTRRAYSALGWELGPALRADVRYSHEWVPPASERPQAESHSNFFDGGLQGEIAPLMTGSVRIGVEDRTSPQAAEGGRNFTGWVASGGVLKELGPATSFRLTGSRSTQLSAFEGNAFYVATSVTGELNLGGPLSIALRLGAGYHTNTYRTDALALGQPREDKITGWSVGAGRPVGRRCFLRADYRRETRNSNLDFLDTTTHAFLIELGLGYFGQTRRP